MTQKSLELPAQLNLKFVTTSLHENVWMSHHTALSSRIACSNEQGNDYEPLSPTHKIDTFPQTVYL